MKEAKLENWIVLTDLFGEKHLQGDVYGNPRFEDGLNIITSPVQKFDEKEMKVTTKNTVYYLGEPLSEKTKAN